MWTGVGKSGCPMQNEITSRPARSSWLTSARTTNAFSVPRLPARRDSAGAPWDAARAEVEAVMGSVVAMSKQDWHQYKDQRRAREEHATQRDRTDTAAAPANAQARSPASSWHA